IARPYSSGDDIRRIHWRASARTGRLMTREDEPSAGQSAVIVLDTSQRENPSAEVEDALVSHAATVLDSLGMNGWEVRIVDASGDEITRTGRRRGIPGPSPLGSEADAVEQRAALLALAEGDFDDDASGGIGRAHAAGPTARATAPGPAAGDPRSARAPGRAASRPPPPPARRSAPAGGPDVGHARERHAERLRAAHERHDPTRSRLGSWSLVRGTAADTLTDLLTAAEAEGQ